MLVKAIADSMLALPKYAQSRYSGSPSVELRLGRVYVVYAMGTWFDRDICYALCDTDFRPCGFPIMYAAMLFEVVDGHLPSCWEVQHEVVGEGDDRRDDFLMGFPPLIRDPAFYENLVDGVPCKPDPHELWMEYKAIIDKEATARLSEEDRDAIMSYHW
jgi:hypothetical protein